MNRHVLILLENEPYPYDVRVRYEAEALLHAGFDVTVAGPTHDAYPRREELVDGVRVLRYQAPPGGLSAIGYLREYSVALLRMRRVIAQVRRERPVDLVLVCNPPDFLALAARRVVRDGAKVIFDHHDLSPELYLRKFGHRGLFHRLLLRLEKLALRSADVVIASNQAYAHIARDRGGVDPRRIFVVRSAPDPHRIFPVPADPELKGGKPHLVVWTGSMTGVDRVALLIEAADHLVNSRGRDDVRFALVGPGDAREPLQREVQQRGLGHAVDFPGPADDDLLRRYLATADVCVSVDPSNEMNDVSTVTKVVDYMAMGRAVVQFPLPEMQGICGDACVYARNGDALDVADRIEDLLADPERREALGAAARRRMLDGRMWPDQVPRLLEAVDTALRAA